MVHRETLPTMLPEAPPPTLRLTVDTDALAHNWRTLDTLSGAAEAGAAIKADCYGLGIDTCLPVLRDAGAAQLFVAHWGEVAAAARHVPGDQIAVLHGPLNRAEADYARAASAVPVINSLEQAELWMSTGGGRCHVMVDTGINRLGLARSELSDARVQGLDVDVLMSHLACADEDSAMNDTQLTEFREAAQSVRHRKLSLANSAGIALGKDYAFDLTRPGLALYGGVPRAEMAQSIRQVAHVEAAIIQRRTLEAGDKVGYNATFTAPRTMRVATVSLGYADGFLRSWAGEGALRFEGERLPLLGRVSMDMIVVDLANAPDLCEGDWLDVPYDLPIAAQQSALSQYELLTVLGQRLK